MRTPVPPTDAALPSAPPPMIARESVDLRSTTARYTHINRATGKRKVKLPSLGEGHPLIVARGRGGLTALTNRTAERILMAIRCGSFRGPAASLAGVHPDTLKRWMRRPEPRFVAFQELVREAEAHAELQAIMIV